MILLKRTRVQRGSGWPRGLGTLLLLFFAVCTTVGAQAPASPRRITALDKQTILITDLDADLQGALVALDKETMQVVWTCAVPGEPLGVARWKNLYLVGDPPTGNVVVYRMTGANRGTPCFGAAAGKTLEFLYNLGQAQLRQPGFFQKVNDLAVDVDLQRVFVVDTGDKKVKVFDNKGGFLYAFPEGSPVLLNPTGIALDETRQEVLVSDYGDPSGSFKPKVPARIVIFGYGGNYLGQVDSSPANPEFFFSKPQGLAVDWFGHIFVVDALLGKVIVFARESGTGIKTFGSPGGQPGQLKLPLDLCLDPSTGDVFVTSNMTGRVEVFRAAGRVP